MIPDLRATVDPAASSGAPLVVLGPSIGTTGASWDAVVDRLRGRYRLLRWDPPGHGASPAASGAFTMAELASAVVALVDDAGGGRFAYAGVSLGGAVGIELALGAAADRLDGLAVVCSDARIRTPEMWRARAAQVRAHGTASLVAGSAARWFAPGFPDREPEAARRALDALAGIDDESYARCAEALAGHDRTGDVGRIAVPTVVVTGDADPIVPIADGDRLAAAIPGAARTVLPRTAHLPNIESPAALTAALLPVLGG